MFGTNRIIEDISLNVYPLTNPDEQECCKAWDCCEAASGHSGTPDLRNPSMKRSVIQA